jgi:hypothetical protein
MADELTEVLCASIDHYRLSQKPGLKVSEILIALERIRFALTERALKEQKIKT